DEQLVAVRRGVPPGGGEGGVAERQGRGRAAEHQLAVVGRRVAGGVAVQVDRERRAAGEGDGGGTRGQDARAARRGTARLERPVDRQRGGDRPGPADRLA